MQTGAADAAWGAAGAGDARALDRLLSEHYEEFRRIARRVLQGDGERLMIQPTELAHEAAVRVLRLERLRPNDRTHLLALSARIMRQVLLDEVRRHRALKRRPPVQTLWRDAEGEKTTGRLDLEAFDEALKRLFEIDAERARVVELRFYAGLTLEEVADVTGESLSTVKRRWRVARAWLVEQLDAA